MAVEQFKLLMPAEAVWSYIARFPNSSPAKAVVLLACDVYEGISAARDSPRSQHCSPTLHDRDTQQSEILIQFITALHAMQMRSSDENSVCLTVCQTRAL